MLVLMRTNVWLTVGAVSTHLGASRTVFIPKSSTVEDTGLIERSPDALRPLTPCNCDCKSITTAIYTGLHRYSMRYIHLAQRCISSRQITDDIFEVEKTALGHVACAPTTIGYHTDRLCRCISWRQSLLDLPRPRQGGVVNSRGVRQGCPASGFQFAMAFDPIFDGSMTRSYHSQKPCHPRLPSTVCVCLC